MMTSDQYLTFGLALFALGLGFGDFLLAFANVKLRRVGRAVKLAAPIAGGVFALVVTIHPQGLRLGAVPLVTAVVVWMFGYTVLMYKLDLDGRLAPLDEPRVLQPPHRQSYSAPPSPDRDVAEPAANAG